MFAFTRCRMACTGVAVPAALLHEYTKLHPCFTRRCAHAVRSSSSGGSGGLLASKGSSVGYSSVFSALSAGVSARSLSTTPVLCSGVFSFTIARLDRRRGGCKGDGRVVESLHGKQRFHGTVTAFKHRRGYGFVLAEGLVPMTATASKKDFFAPLDTLGSKQPGAPDVHPSEEAAAKGRPGTPGTGAPAGTEALHRTYFFLRGSLEGGFYLTEGERVSFLLETIDPEDGKRRYLSAPELMSVRQAAPSDLAQDFALEAAAAEAEAAADATASAEDASSRMLRAAAIRLYDLKTNQESPVTPITLYGKLVEWDEARGVGVLAELDTHRNFHADAPRFPVHLEDCDLSLSSSLAVGRYVRFCLGRAPKRSDTTAARSQGPAQDLSLLLEEDAPQDADGASQPSAEETELVAQRVVLDLNLEKRKGAFGRPLVPASAAPGTVTDQTRFHGVVREIRGGRFGFIADDLSGESIFFHGTNARPDVREGDRVTYLLREMVRGRHEGKKACFDVRRAERAAASARPAAAVATAREEMEEMEEEEELPRVEQASDGAPVKRGEKAAAVAGKKRMAPPKRRGDEDGLGFELL